MKANVGSYDHVTFGPYLSAGFNNHLHCIKVTIDWCEYSFSCFTAIIMTLLGVWTIYSFLLYIVYYLPNIVYYLLMYKQAIIIIRLILLRYNAGD